MVFLNGSLDLIWYELKVPMMHMWYCNYTMVYEYQWYISMVEPEESRVKAQIMDANNDKPYLEEVSNN